MIRAASVSVALGIILAFSSGISAAADPVVETALPADGVLSIERLDETHVEITFSSAPTEVKIMTSGWEGRAEQCGVNAHVNYGLPLCQLVTVIAVPAATPACMYLQVDGVAGENSSDPFVCRVVPISSSTPTQTPAATPTPEPSEPPTSTPEPSASGTPEPSPSATTPVDCAVVADECSTSSVAVDRAESLASTGVAAPYLLLAALALFLFAAFAFQWKSLRPYLRWKREFNAAVQQVIDEQNGQKS